MELSTLHKWVLQHILHLKVHINSLLPFSFSLHPRKPVIANISTASPSSTATLFLSCLTAVLLGCVGQESKQWTLVPNNSIPHTYSKCLIFSSQSVVLRVPWPLAFPRAASQRGPVVEWHWMVQQSLWSDTAVFCQEFGWSVLRGLQPLQSIIRYCYNQTLSLLPWCRDQIGSMKPEQVRLQPVEQSFLLHLSHEPSGSVIVNSSKLPISWAWTKKQTSYNENPWQVRDTSQVAECLPNMRDIFGLIPCAI